MEGKREKEENPIEVNTYKEWDDRKARTKTQKVTLASLLSDTGNMLQFCVFTVF